MSADPWGKWRPPMALVLALVSLLLISVPVLAFLSMRLTSNQFVRETEQTLIDQAAIYAAVYADLLRAQDRALDGQELAADAQSFWSSNLHPWRPTLNMRRVEVLPPLPDFGAPGLPQPEVPDDRYTDLAPRLLALARTSRKATLSGAIFLDQRGVNIRAEQPQDFGFAPEVQAALAGNVGTALRNRGDDYDRHLLTSISRDTWYRVFVAYPVIVDARVVGVVYLSRTPSNFAKFAHSEWAALAVMLGVSVLSAAAVGWLLLRLFSRPVRSLSAQGTRIANGTLSEPLPLHHYGVRELADLGQSVIQMAKTLTDRSRQIATYTDHVTHELKSPVTAISAAAELLQSQEISQAARSDLHRNIEVQAVRMNTLLDKLRQMSRLRDAPTTGDGPLAEMLPEIPGLEITVAENSEVTVPMLPEHGQIVFHQLARNAVEHGASRMVIGYRSGLLEVIDNGEGIPPEHIDKVTEPFFTTRRDSGGTGLGLAIVAAILQNYRATVAVRPSDSGARIEVRFTS